MHYGTVLADKFAAMLKMRHLNKPQNKLRQPSGPGLSRNLEVANVTRIFLFYVNSMLKSLLNAFTHTQNAPVKL